MKIRLVFFGGIKSEVMWYPIDTKPEIRLVVTDVGEHKAFSGEDQPKLEIANYEYYFIWRGAKEPETDARLYKQVSITKL